MPAINRGTYFEARFKTSPGKYQTIYDENGKPRRYPTKQLAETACREEEIVCRVLSTRHDGPVRLYAGLMAVRSTDPGRRRDARAALRCTG